MEGGKDGDGRKVQPLDNSSSHRYLPIFLFLLLRPQNTEKKRKKNENQRDEENLSAPLGLIGLGRTSTALILAIMTRIEKAK